MRMMERHSVGFPTSESKDALVRLCKKSYVQLTEKLKRNDSAIAMCVLKECLERAQDEVMMNTGLYYQCMQKRINHEEWCLMDEDLKWEHIIEFGSCGIIQDAVLCVEYSEQIPYCIAIVLLLIAESKPLQERLQIIDVGDALDLDPFERVLQKLSVCDVFWDYEIIQE